MILYVINREIEKRLNMIQKQLDYVGLAIDARIAFRICLVACLFLILLSFIYSQLILFSLIPGALFFVIPSYFVAKRKSEIEYYLTDALFQASSLSEFMNLDEVIKTLAESNYGALSQEFNLVYKRLKSGEAFDVAMKKMIKRNNSRILERSLNIIVMGYSTGADISQSLKEVAEDLSKTYDSHRQRAASLTVEKYTLLFAGAIIVPAILGTMTSLVGSFDLSGLSDFGLGVEKQLKESILSNSLAGNQVYIVVYSLMASIFVALQENKIEKSLIYVSILIPASYLIFSFFSSVKVL